MKLLKIKLIKQDKTGQFFFNKQKNKTKQNKKKKKKRQEK